MNETNTKTAAARLRELYPNHPLAEAITLLIDRVERAEEAIKKYSNEAISAKEKAYEFDKRYCDILVEKRQLEKENKALKKALYAVYGTDEEFTFVDVNQLKGKANPTYLGYPVDPENPENCKVRLEELEK